MLGKIQEDLADLDKLKQRVLQEIKRCSFVCVRLFRAIFEGSLGGVLGGF